MPSPVNMKRGLSENETQLCLRRKTAYDCFIACGRQMPAAIAAFSEQWNTQRDKGDKYYASDVRNLIKRAVAAMDTRYSLRTVPPPGPQPKAPKEVMVQIGGIVGAGHTQNCVFKVDNLLIQYIEHRHFTSLVDAQMHSPTMAALMKQYKMDTEYVRKKIHQYCPQLVWRALRMRRPLKLPTMQQRAALGQDMLHRIQAQPDYLQDVHFMDECTIWVGKDLVSEKLHVWCYRSVADGEPPAPNPLFLRERSFKVNLLLVVSGRDGCTYAEILSGTQGIDPAWRDTLGMQVKMLERGRSTYKAS